MVLFLSLVIFYCYTKEIYYMFYLIDSILFAVLFPIDWAECVVWLLAQEFVDCEYTMQTKWTIDEKISKSNNNSKSGSPAKKLLFIRLIYASKMRILEENLQTSKTIHI